MIKIVYTLLAVDRASVNSLDIADKSAQVIMMDLS